MAPTIDEMVKSPWRFKAKVGSPQYIHNLQKLRSIHGDSAGIQKALKAAEMQTAKKSSFSVLGKLGGPMMYAGMIAAPAFFEEGPINEKARAVTKGIASVGGWEVGSRVGLAVGAAAGSAVLPGIGSFIGGVIGFIGGGLLGAVGAESVIDFVTRIPDRMVERERNRRGFNWGQDTAAFQTKRAHTMRQQALGLMNRGQMSARSLLGQEATFVHR